MDVALANNVYMTKVCKFDRHVRVHVCMCITTAMCVRKYLHESPVITAISDHHVVTVLVAFIVIIMVVTSVCSCCCCKQAVKRLMTQSQKYFPTDPSKMVNFVGDKH